MGVTLSLLVLYSYLIFLKIFFKIILCAFTFSLFLYVWISYVSSEFIVCYMEVIFLDFHSYGTCHQHLLFDIFLLFLLDGSISLSSQVPNTKHSDLLCIKTGSITLTEAYTRVEG